jgi:hypothetical protein
MLLLLVCFFHFLSYSQNEKITSADSYLKDRGEVFFRFVTSHHLLELLSNSISIDRVRIDTVYAYANLKEFNSFIKFGIEYEVLAPPSMQNIEEKPKSTQALSQWSAYPTYDDYLAMMDSFAILHPDLCKKYEIGTSVQGRKLLFIKVSDNVYQKEAEPEFMYSSTMHGDEVTGYILLLRLIDYLLSNYGKDSYVTKLVDNTEIWINPLANPDGAYFTGNASVNGATRYNANHIDLNRNYPDPQDGQHPDGEAWQPENIAMINFMKTHNFVFSANYHGGAEVVNYPWDTWSDPHPDKNWFQSVSKQYADTVKKYGDNNYFSDVNWEGYINGYYWYTISGGRQDYVTYFRNGREITIEVSETKMPVASDLPDYWIKNCKAMLNYIEQCLFGIRGIVTDSLTGAPVKSKIEVIGHDADSSQVYSDSINGNYHRMIYPGTYDLKFSAKGYYDKIVTSIIVENRNTTDTVNVKLIPIGVSRDIREIEISLNPNPFSQQPEFTCILPSDGLVEMVFFDISGKKIYQYKNYFPYKGKNQFTVDRVSFANGIYFCKVSFNKSYLKTIKIIKL